jgi:DNA polymerase III delta prime subunit
MNSHHAVLLLSDSFANSGYTPDTDTETVELTISHFEVLAIGDVRKLIQTAFLKPLEADVKIIVIEAKGIAREAQHALLKIFEEPPLSTKFILVLPGIEGLLPTVLSRVSMPYGLSVTAPTTNPFFTIFQASSYAARLECIARITKDKDSDQIELLRRGVVWLLAQTPLPPQASSLAYCVETMNVRGASKKMLLEEIALLLPTSTN